MTAGKAARSASNWRQACRHPWRAQALPCRRQDVVACHRPWERLAAEALAIPLQAGAPPGAVRLAVLGLPALGPGLPVLAPLPWRLPAFSLLLPSSLRSAFSPRLFSLSLRVSRQASWPPPASQAPCGPLPYGLRSSAPGPSSWRWSSSLPPVRRSPGGWSFLRPSSCSLCVSSHSFS